MALENHAEGYKKIRNYLLENNQTDLAGELKAIWDDGKDAVELADQQGHSEAIDGSTNVPEDTK